MPHTLLLADDSVTIQRVIELTFADEDIRVVAVSDGDEAIAALDRTPPDIVLADVGMPGRDGYQVAEHVRNTPRLAHIPVLLLTGAFEPIDQARAAQVQCDGVLAKPFEPQLVIARVKELLARPKDIPAALDAALLPPPVPEPWPSILDEPEPAAPGPISAFDAPADVDQYFDRLDRAFANLSNPESQEAPKPAARHVADDVDWFATMADAPPASASSAPAPTPDLMLAPPAPIEAPPLPPPDPILPPPPRPQLADAFAALLAAEQAVPPPAPSVWPIVPPEPPSEAVISDAVIEDIVRRVLDRLSDRVVRETVAGIVSDVAERLVREEIERIKSAQT